MRRGVKVLGIATGCALLAALGAGVVFREDLRGAWWRWQEGRELSAEQRRAVDNCEEVGGWVWPRAVVAGVEPQCAELTISRRLLGAGGKRWLASVATDPSRSQRLRARTGLALFLMGEPAIAGLGWALRDPTVARGARAALFEQGELDGVQFGPWLQLERDVAAVVSGDAGPSARLRYLLNGGWVHLDKDEAQSVQTALLDESGWSLDALRAVWDQRTQGRSLAGDGRLVELKRVLEGSSMACASEGSLECLALAWDLWELSQHDADASHDAAPYSMTDEALALELLGAWLDGADDPEGRLLAVLSNPLSAYEVGTTPSPLQALRDRRSGPWTVASLYARAAQRAGLDVGVHGHDGMVTLRGPRREVGLDVCGGALPVDPEHELGPRWPLDAITARALVEASWGLDEPARRRQMSHARALDPLGVPRAPEATSKTLGSVAAGLLRPLDTPAPVGAEDARREMALRLSERPDCAAIGPATPP